jgi:hypothetical protein
VHLVGGHECLSSLPRIPINHISIVRTCLENNNWCNSCIPVGERCFIYSQFSRFDQYYRPDNYVLTQFELFRETLCPPTDEIDYQCDDTVTAYNFCRGYIADIRLNTDALGFSRLIDDENINQDDGSFYESCLDECASVVRNQFYCPCSE